MTADRHTGSPDVVRGTARASGVAACGAVDGAAKQASGLDTGRSEHQAAPAASPPADAALVGLPPVVGPGTRLVVLGSFPGAASLARQQYYGHPRNHFWPLVGAILGVDFVALAYAERLARLCEHGVGLWDVHASCRRVGSLDQHITEPLPNDLARLRRLAPGLRLIAHNGGESARAMKRTAALGVPVLRLPSSSPANASWSFDRKLAAWRAAFAAAGVAAPA